MESLTALLWLTFVKVRSLCDIIKSLGAFVKSRSYFASFFKILSSINSNIPELVMSVKQMHCINLPQKAVSETHSNPWSLSNFWKKNIESEGPKMSGPRQKAQLEQAQDR